MVRKGDFLTKYGIDVSTNAVVQQVNYKKKVVVLEDGTKVPYNKLLIASGCETLVPPIPGSENIEKLTLRNHNDLEKIREAVLNSNTKNVTIIGSSFIGVELSSALKLELKDKVNITLIESQKTPFSRVFGPQVG